jgi:hypothetical protein
MLRQFYRDLICRNVNRVKVPIPVGAKLSVEQCPKTQEEVEDMSYVPYASAFGSLMYVMVCTRPNICPCSGKF